MEEPIYQPNTEFKDIRCRACSFEGQPITGKTNVMHGYALYCPQCNMFWGWSGRKKVMHDEDGNRKFSTQWPPKRIGIDFCQSCLRTEDQLGDGECLESHHIIEIKDGGEDNPQNIWVVCTACHKMIHHRRTYLYRHLRKFYDAHKRMEALNEQP